MSQLTKQTLDVEIISTQAFIQYTHAPPFTLLDMDVPMQNQARSPIHMCAYTHTHTQSHTYTHTFTRARMYRGLFNISVCVYCTVHKSLISHSISHFFSNYILYAHSRALCVQSWMQNLAMNATVCVLMWYHAAVSLLPLLMTRLLMLSIISQKNLSCFSNKWEPLTFGDMSLFVFLQRHIFCLCVFLCGGVFLEARQGNFICIAHFIHRAT